MSNQIKFIVLFVLMSLCVDSVMAQVTPDQIAQGREMLSDKDISEDEVREKLEERGIDPDNIPPEMLPEMESIMQEIIAEIEAEKGLDSKTSAANSKVGFSESTVKSDSAVTEDIDGDSEPVIEEIDGSSIDEVLSDALTNEIQERQSVSSVVFGQHIFKNKSVEVYRVSESAYTPDNYILDVGDEISVTIFGTSQADLAYEIETDGFIRPSNMSKIYVKGVSVGRAKTLIKNRFRQAYSYGNDQISISIKSARTITVNIFGEVQIPGSYTISALNTAVNAIMAAGGVKDNGSVRKIQIVRNGRTKYIDLYDYINSPGKNVDMHLENGDILYVPIIERTASISGAVKRPATYEVLAKEDFLDLLQLANGFRANADKQLMNATFFSGNKPMHKDVDLAGILAKSLKQELNDQDAYFIRSYKAEAEDFVVLQGPVDYPGTYAHTPGMRLADLLAKGEVQKYARNDFGYVFRTNVDGSASLLRVDWDQALKNPASEANIELQSQDVLVLYTQASFRTNYQVSISGGVRKPAAYFYSENRSMTILDLIQLSGGLSDIAADFGYVIHSSTNNPELTRYETINVKQLMDNPSSNANLKLQKGDRVFIFSSPTFTDQRSVEVIGAVRQEVSVPYSANLSLRDLLTLAGGLRAEAASNRIDVFRQTYENNKATQTIVQTVTIDHDFDPLTAGKVLDIQPGDVIAVRQVPEFELMRFVRLTGEVKYPGQYAIVHQHETLADLIERAGGLTEEAYPSGAILERQSDFQDFMVIELLDAINKPNSKANIRLKEGDHIAIPKIMDHTVISVEGTNAEMVFTDEMIEDEKIHVGWAGKRSARWYINNFAGGFSKRADRNKTQVVMANGRIKRTRSFMFIRFYPKVKAGAMIVAYEKPEKEKKERKREKITGDDIFRTLSNTLALATSTLTVILLSNNL